jgi:hypothetical protein
VRKGAGIAVVLAALCCSAAPPAEGAQAQVRHCRPVLDPYPNTRYEGVDLTRIRTTGVKCRQARRVVRRAHYEALGLPPPLTGVRRFDWHGWRVRGDLRGDSDRYVARRDGKVVRWRF